MRARGVARWRQTMRRIRERIERVVPGFDDFNERLSRDGSIVLPHAVRDRREFATASGRAHFTVHPLPPAARRPAGT